MTRYDPRREIASGQSDFRDVTLRIFCPKAVQPVQFFV